MLDPLRLRAVDAVPRPLGVAVQPHAVVPALAPAPLRQRERRLRRHGLERLAERSARDAAARHLARDVLEPERPLEPPVAEELRVVGRAHDGGPGRARLAERRLHELDEVPRLERHLLRGHVGVVDLLAAEVAGVVGDAPEAQAAGEVLLVELEICCVPGVAVLAAPDLERRLRVAEERHRAAGAAARRHAVGQVRRAPPGPGHGRGGLARPQAERHEVAVEEDGVARGDQVGVGDEILEPLAREHLLQAGPYPPDAPAVAPGRRRPLVTRPVGALREPDATRRPAKVAAVRLDGGAELEPDRFVAPEQRQVAVRGRAGDDLDVPGAPELGEGAGDVAADPAVHFPHPLVEFLPERGEPEDLLLARAPELLARIHAGAPHVLVVKRQFLLELGRGELLGEHGREVDRPLGGDAVGDQPVGRLEER